jgi:cell division protein FtsQ
MTELELKDRLPRAPKPELPIDPRVLARWVSVRQDKAKRRWRAATIALSLVTVLVGVWILARSPLLAVRHVDLRGGSHTTRREVLVAAGLDHRRPMLSVDAARVRRGVAALPWVATVAVGRHWPASVTISITERVPVAQMTGPAGQKVVVDGQGRVLATVGPGPAALLTLPQIQGGPSAGLAGTSVTATAGAALALLGAVTSPALAGQLTAVTQAPDGMLRATFSPGPVTIVFGSADELAAKVVAARALVARITPGTAATVDVRVVDAPVLTNERNSSMVSTTQRG